MCVFVRLSRLHMSMFGLCVCVIGGAKDFGHRNAGQDVGRKFQKHLSQWKKNKKASDY